MACNSVLCFNSSSSLNQLRSNHSNSVIRNLILPSPPNTFSSPPTRHQSRRRQLIISEMNSSKTESAPQFHDEGTDRSISSGGDQNSSAPPPASISSSSSGQNLHWISVANIPTWAKLVLGSIVVLAIPFFRKSIRIKDVTRTVEEVAEVVEQVAEMTEKVAGTIAQAFPPGSSVRKAAIRLEKIAFLVDKEAEITEAVISKVDDAMEVLEATHKPVIDDGEVKFKADERNLVTPTKIIVTATSELNEGPQR